LVHREDTVEAEAAAVLIMDCVRLLTLAHSKR